MNTPPQEGGAATVGAGSFSEGGERRRDIAAEVDIGGAIALEPVRLDVDAGCGGHDECKVAIDSSSSCRRDGS